MAKIRGGLGKPVQVIGDSDLAQNGGKYIVVGRNAVPVHGLNLGERKIVGGNAVRVYPVTTAQIQSGAYKVAGGAAVPMYDISRGGLKRTLVSGRQAMPVYVVSGQALGFTNYSKKVLGTASANLIGYWPMWEPSGGVADNFEGTAARDGAYTGVSLGQPGIGDGRTSPLFDGINSYCDIYSTSLRDALDTDAGTLLIWMKVISAPMWSDSANHVLAQFYADSNNFILIKKAVQHNRLEFTLSAGGTAETINDDTQSGNVSWTCCALTWNKTGVGISAYINGVQTGSDQAIAGIWAGNIAENETNIGASDEVPIGGWYGNLAHCAIWTTPLTAPQIALLAVV